MTELAIQFINWVSTVFIWFIALVLLAMGLFGGSISVEIKGLERFLK